MRQEPGLIELVHAPLESVQLSVVHERPSSQLVAAEHAPPLHWPHVVAAPSSQRVPEARFDHAVGLAAASQNWQGPFAAPFA